MNKRLFINLVPLLAASVLALPAAAQAAAPELGRCVKVTAGTGKYKDAGCEKGVVPNGKYEWEPGTGSSTGALKNKFTSKEGKSTLETVGGLKITCMSDTDKGEYTGPKTDTETIVFKGCKYGTVPCQNSTTLGGTVTTTSLTSVIGFIKAPNEVGVSLEASAAGSPFAEFQCGSFTVVITGSVIAPVTPISKMTLKFKEDFKATGGKQEPESFEAEPKDTLNCARYESATGVLISSEQCGLTSADKVTNEELLEINEVL
jgi:hypothetical protein